MTTKTDTTTNNNGADATPQIEQGGLLPRMGEQTALDGEGFEKPVKNPITGEAVTCTPGCDNCGAETCNLRQESTGDSDSLGAGWGMGCGGNGWRPAGEEQEPAA